MLIIVVSAVMFLIVSFTLVQFFVPSHEPFDIDGTIYFSDGIHFLSYNLKTKEKKKILMYSGSIWWTDPFYSQPHNRVFLHVESLGDKYKFIDEDFYGNGSFLLTGKEIKVEGVKGAGNTRLLSLSPNGRRIAYLKDLSLFFRDYPINPDDGSVIEVAQVMKNKSSWITSVEWISDVSFLFNDVDNNIVIYDITKKSRRILGSNLYLGTISTDRKKVTAINIDGVLFVIDVSSGKVLEEKSYWLSAIVGGGIWSPDSRYLVFDKLRPSGILTLTEYPDIWIYDTVDKKDYLLIKSASLFGGFWLPN